MTAAFQGRPPWPELTLLVGGIVSGLVAGSLDFRGWATASAWVCVFAVVAAIVTLFLSPRSTGVHLAVFTIGAIATIWGVLWFFDHGDEPYIFSPIFVGYLGGGLALSAAVTLLYRTGGKQPRRVSR